MSNKEYLSNVPAERFNELIPARNKIIEAASDEFPKYEYNANVVARELHPKMQHVIVTGVEELNGAKRYTLGPDTSAGTDKLAYFRAGQYISLRLKIGDSNVTRPYSLCSSPSLSLEGKYQILVKTMNNGFASEYINREFKVGTKIEISAPSGFFVYEPIRDKKTVIGIAGGSGIAPFISLAKAIADGSEDFELKLLYGSKTESDILLKDELDALQEKCPKIKVIHVLSDEKKDGYENGFISADLIKRYAELAESSFFACGSQGMYEYIQKELESLGLPRRQIRFDAYGEYRLTDRDGDFTGKHSGQTYRLTVTTNDGKTSVIPAKADEPILVALERAGIKAPSKCRSGECGFCRSRLVSGDVYTPSRVERRRQYDKENGYIHPCCTFPCSDCNIQINCEEPKIERTVKDMKKKERLMSIIMAILMSAAMGAVAAFLVIRNNPDATRSTPVAILYISNILLSIIIGVIVALVVPLGKLGRGLARKANANPPGMKFTLLNSLPLSVGNTIIISFFVSLYGVVTARAKMPPEILTRMPPMVIMWLGNWVKLLLPTLIISYVLAVVLSPLVSQMVGLASAGAEVGAAAASEKKE